jgi:hypothetical protein
LKFNRSFEKGGAARSSVMRCDRGFLQRFFSKFVLDIMPAALASLVGGFLLTHYGFGRASEPAAQAAPASAEMMALLRDEHGLIVNFLKAQIANEKKELAAQDVASRVAVDPAPAPLAVSRPATVTPVAMKPAARVKAAIVGASLPPLVIAQAQPTEAAGSAPQNTNSFLARTIGIKDHVVLVTHRVVSVIGGIPSLLGSIGDHIGGRQDTNPRPPADLVSAS